MKKHNIKEIVKRIPLKTRLKVLYEMNMIDLLTELGYREGMWTDEEDDKLQKLCNCAKSLVDETFSEIKEWEQDGKPE